MSELIKTAKEKQKVLDSLVEELLKDGDIKAFYRQNQLVLKEVTPFDVFSISYFHEDANLEIRLIKEIAGKLINLLYEGLANYRWEKENTSLFLKYLLKEGQAIKDKFDQLKPLIKAGIDKDKLLPLFADFEELNKRFLKMQNIIYPNLEKALVNPKPLQVMWSLHDEAKALLEELLEKLPKNDSTLNRLLGKYFFLVYGIIEKEELLVLPIAGRVIKEDKWEEMLQEALDYGFCFLKLDYQKSQLPKEKTTDSDLLFNSETGGLNLDELLGLLNQIPLDLTFVDEYNQVKYFNNPKERIFPRSPSVIGREVSKCHPPKSVHVVEEIIEEFRKGKQDEAKFWLQSKDRFLLITYYAIRDKSGNYKGVLEASQDVTEIKSLTGEQKILSWKRGEN